MRAALLNNKQCPSVQFVSNYGTNDLTVQSELYFGHKKKTPKQMFSTFLLFSYAKEMTGGLDKAVCELCEWAQCQQQALFLFLFCLFVFSWA